MDIALVDRPTRLVALVRDTVRTDELAGFYDTAYGRVLAAVQAAGGTLSGPAIGWYGGIPQDTVDVAAGFSVDGLPVGELADGVEVVEQRGGPAVVALHAGGYEGLGPAWEQVERWRSQHVGAGRGDFWEEYLNEPTPDGDPADNRTRLVLPLA